jgi:hypothetical protein
VNSSTSGGRRVSDKGRTRAQQPVAAVAVGEETENRHPRSSFHACVPTQCRKEGSILGQVRYEWSWVRRPWCLIYAT